MYKALRDYTAPTTHTLSFKAGEVLCLLEKTNDAWWLASNSDGKTGYIPCSYVKLNEQSSTNDDVVLQSIDRAIAAVYASSDSGKLSAEQNDILRKLNKHKQSIMSLKNHKQSHKRQAPPPPSRVTRSTPPPPPQRSTSTKRPAPQVGDSVSPNNEQLHKNGVPAKETAQVIVHSNTLNSSENVTTNSTTLDKFDPKVPVQLGQELVDRLQAECRIPEAKSRDVIESLLLMLGESIPPMASVMNEIIESLPIVEITTDPSIVKLKLSLENLTEIKNDAQQRNWAIEDDEEKISMILSDIMDSLSTGPKLECVGELKQDHYDYVIMLTTYYQMESRISIRLLVLQVLGMICALSSKFVSVLITTVLPNELVLDIVDHSDEIQRVCYSALMLSMVFSTGEPIPLSYYDTIGEKFIRFILDGIEDGIEGDAEDRVPDVFVRLILAFNLHFLIPDENIVMKCISSKNSCTSLSERVMLLVNRGDDPVKFDEEELEGNPPPNSVLKFLQDIFSREDTGQSFLYTNDLLVLTDIIARNITDLPPGLKARTDCLDLLLNVVAHSPYKETKHRAVEIKASLERIKNEELPSDAAEQSVVKFDKEIVSTILSSHYSCFV